MVEKSCQKKEYVADNNSIPEASAGDLVIHKSYGDGKIKKIDGGFLIAAFNGVNREFQYPACFENGFLTIKKD